MRAEVFRQAGSTGGAVSKLLDSVFDKVHDEIVRRSFNRGDLPEVPWTVWVGLRIDGEVRNGGFGQLFDNLRGAVSVDEMQAALRRMGANGHAAALARKVTDAWYEPAQTLRHLAGAYLDAHVKDPWVQASVAPGQPWGGGTWLHNACHDRNPDFVRSLIAEGLPLNTRDRWDKTPAMHLFSQGAPSSAQAECLQALLEAGLDKASMEALLWDAWESRECIELLLDAGADIDAPVFHTRTLISRLVADRGHGKGDIDAIIAMLVDRGASMPEMWYAKTPRRIDLLLDHGAPIDPEPDAEGIVPGFSALHESVLERDVKLVRHLLARGADPNLRTSEPRRWRDHAAGPGMAALDIAVFNNHPDLIGMIEAAGGRPADREAYAVMHVSAVTDGRIGPVVPRATMAAVLAETLGQPIEEVEADVRMTHLYGRPAWHLTFVADQVSRAVADRLAARLVELGANACVV